MQEPVFALAIGALCALLGHGSLAGQQAPDWVATYTGPGSEVDNPYAIAADNLGRVWVSGSSNRGIIPPGKPDDVCSDDDICRDWMTLMYSPEGEELWRMPYGGPGQSTDDAYVLGVDREGNAYVGGTASQAEGGRALTTIKYSVEGEELWVRSVMLPGQSFGRAWALVVVDETIYVFGQTSSNAQTAGRLVTVKYSADGAQQWIAERGSTATRENKGKPQTLTLDENGNVYVTGAYLQREPAVLFGYLTIKYSPSGEELWARTFAGTGDLASPIAVRVDTRGNTLVTGRVRVRPFDSDFATVKYSASGDELWSRRYNGPGHASDTPQVLAVDSAGNVYVAGSSLGAGEVRGIATVKYSPDGDELWVRRLEREGWSFQQALAMTLRPDGGPLVAGSNEGSCMVVHYSPAGGVLQELEYGWPRDFRYAGGAVLGPEGMVHATTGVFSQHSGANYVTLQYSPPSFDFRRGDTDSSGRVDIADPIETLRVLFLGRGQIACEDAVDSNDDGLIDMADAITTLGYLFLGGPGIPEPGPGACGPDPTPDPLGCASQLSCQ